MDDRPRVNVSLYCYHEAGHAVAFWHYGIGLQYVTMMPPADSGYTGLTKIVDRGEITGAEIDADMRCTAAGEIAQKRFFTSSNVPISFNGSRSSVSSTTPSRHSQRSALPRNSFIALSAAIPSAFPSTGYSRRELLRLPSWRHMIPV